MGETLLTCFSQGSYSATGVLGAPGWEGVALPGWAPCRHQPRAALETDVRVLAAAGHISGTARVPTCDPRVRGRTARPLCLIQPQVRQRTSTTRGGRGRPTPHRAVLGVRRCLPLRGWGAGGGPPASPASRSSGRTSRAALRLEGAASLGCWPGPQPPRGDSPRDGPGPGRGAVFLPDEAHDPPLEVSSRK